MPEAPSLFDDLPGPDSGPPDPVVPAPPPAQKRAPEPELEGASAPESAAEPAPPRPHVLTVGEVTREIRDRLEQFGRVSVEGEVSRITRAASGHVYFDLKDKDAKLACVIWRSNVRSAARFELKEGMQVIAHGRLDVYAPRGTYSLNVQRLEQSGIGVLLVQFEELKRELKGRGWFDRARALPSMPAVIGVVTSRDGAAFRDFLRTRSLRWPLYPVRLAHTAVQGPGAARQIADAVRRLDASGVELIVVCRGGGSLEDLWAFNELPVAEAIWNASVPVVSGVGHEVDTTLADLVADRRAHTPTDAAQTVIPERAALAGELERLGAWLAQAVDAAVTRREERLVRAGTSRVLRDARWITGDRERDLRELARRLEVAGARRTERTAGLLQGLHRRLEARSPRRLLEARASRVERAGERLFGLAERRLGERAQRLELAAAKLDAFSPLKILGRGYSITTRSEDSKPLRRAADTRPGQELITRLADGSVVSKVTEVAGSDEHGSK
jgi:exodeoxyribonuclease VII large subunit